MYREILNKLTDSKKEMLEGRLSEYKNNLSSDINRARNSTDYENIGVQAVRYATAIAKLEGELQLLQDMMLYIKE